MRGSVLLFGCLGQVGHYLHHSMGGQFRLRDTATATPWGYDLDGKLAPQDDINPTGKTAFHQKDGWSAVSFWDCSVDHRPKSNTTFLIQELVTEEELLAAARDQWPEVFSRPGFPLSDRPRP